MTAFRRVGSRPHAAAAVICLFLWTSSPYTPSSLSHAALAFAPHRVAAVGGPPRAWGASSLSPPTATSLPSRGRGEVLGERHGPRTCPRRNSGGRAPDGRRPPTSWALCSKPRRYDIDLTAHATDEEAEAPADKEKAAASAALKKDVVNIATLVGAQALLIPVSLVLARALALPRHGLGAGFGWTAAAAAEGLRWTLPLFAVAGALRLLEPHSPALQDVTKATQRSVLAVFGKRRRPAFALVVSLLLGAVAGLGEEWLFRGVFQTALSAAFSPNIALAASGLVFGLLHAVTPVYALLAGAASVFFGYLYNASGNLAVPMICHGAYDVGALLWAHWTVTALSTREQDDILASGYAPSADATARD